MSTVILYNPLSNNSHGINGAENVKNFFPEDSFEMVDVLKVDNIRSFLTNLGSNDRVVLCGGDGTLHHFVNDVDGLEIKRDIYFYSVGTGNDFLKDIGKTIEDGPFIINDYIKHLPFVTVNGKTMRFINNVGFGLDGYCCEEADRQRIATKKKKINYTAIALKGLMGDYQPADAVVFIDGVKKSFKNVWLAPTMQGRYCGGGMMISPTQDRTNPERTVTNTIIHSVGKFKALTRFKSIFKGEHIKYKEMVEYCSGHEIRVVFDTPCALQVDGETFTGVLTYSVRTDLSDM